MNNGGSYVYGHSQTDGLSQIDLFQGLDWAGCVFPPGHNSPSRLSGQTKRTKAVGKPKVNVKARAAAIDAFFNAKGWEYDKATYSRWLRAGADFSKACGEDIDLISERMSLAKAFFELKEWEWTLDTAVKWLPEIIKGHHTKYYEEEGKKYI